MEHGRASSVPAVMIISASSSDGDDRATPKLEAQVHECWPASEIRRIDIRQVMGPRIGSLAHTLKTIMEWVTPEGGSSAAWRRVITRAGKRLLGSWSGRYLASAIERDEPTLIVSTHPLGSAGLAWLRRNRSLPTPTGSWAAGAPLHPLWVYPELDLTVVSDPTAALRARVMEPSARIRALAPGPDSDGRPEPDDFPALAELAAVRPAGPATIGSTRASTGRLDRAHTGWPLPASDSMFFHIDSEDVAQQAGAVMTLTPGPDALPLTAESVAAHIERNLALAPMLRRQLVSRGRLREPGWVVADTLTVAEHVTEHRAADRVDHDRRLDRFWSDPPDLDRPPWHMIILHTNGSHSCTIAFKIHHTLGDGFSLIESVGRLFDTEPAVADGSHGAAATHHRGEHRHRDATDSPETGHRIDLRQSARQAGRIARGLGELARHARAPRSSINRRLTRQRRGVMTVGLPTGQIREIARAHHARSSEVSLALVAEALHRSGLPDGAGRRPGSPDPEWSGAGAGQVLRAMMPVAVGSRPGRQRSGNQTGAASITFPVGPMAVSDRIAMIKTDLRYRVELGEPDAAAFVVRAMGAFPAPVHGWMARRVYNAHFLNLLTGYIPGPLRQWNLYGNQLTEIFPVMALATGVTLAVGVMRYADVTGFGLLFDESIRSDIPDVCTAIREVLDELVADQAV